MRRLAFVAGVAGVAASAVGWAVAPRGAGAPQATAAVPRAGGEPRPDSGWPGEEILRVLSFNIRYDEPADGPHAWPHRSARVAGLLRRLAPDAAGLQEALAGQVRDLAAALPEYAWIGAGRDDGVEAGEFSPIFYRRERLEPLDSGTFWLSPEPGRPGSVGWDAALPRIATWARLRDRATGGRLLVLNTHFDHEGVRARAESARLLRERACRLAEGDPVIVTGDLNAAPDEMPLRMLAEADASAEAGAEAGPHPGIELLDARPLAAAIAGPEGTFSGFVAGEPPERRIDYVLVGPRVDVLRHAHVLDLEGGAYPSDHLPVLAELRVVEAAEAGRPASREGADPCPSGS